MELRAYLAGFENDTTVEDDVNDWIAMFDSHDIDLEDNLRKIIEEKINKLNTTIGREFRDIDGVDITAKQLEPLKSKYRKSVHLPDIDFTKHVVSNQRDGEALVHTLRDGDVVDGYDISPDILCWWVEVLDEELAKRWIREIDVSNVLKAEVSFVDQKWKKIMLLDRLETEKVSPAIIQKFSLKLDAQIKRNVIMQSALQSATDFTR